MHPGCGCGPEVIATLAQFPETRHTLIRRLADSGSESDWRQFLSDYWRPVCRFSARWGRLGLDDAEDVASTTFVVLLEGNLLKRWIVAPQSKLRTLLCSVVRNVISNRARVQSGRERILAEQGELLRSLGTVELGEASAQDSAQEDAFYAAWAEELLQKCLGALHEEYLRTGRGDYFRVLYGRVCEGLGNVEIAAGLNRKVTDVENYYKRARQHLSEQLQAALADQVRRYCPPGDAEDEVRVEWERLGAFLQASGGLERAVRNSYELSGEVAARERSSQTTILQHLRQTRRGNHGVRAEPPAPE